MSEQQSDLPRSEGQTAPARQGGLPPIFIGLIVVGVFLVAVLAMVLITQNDVAETPAPATLSQTAEEGKALYTGIGQCNGCHPKEGRAAGVGPRLSTTNLSDNTIAEYIRKGKGAMPPNNAVTDAQIQKIIGYIRELKPTK